ncbi:MAG: chemotaxis protein CheC [Exiguobacterium sp.]|uniref:Chemotaxis protein CheC n=1 Tax=Exiguobacterium alkaliphilum TaxID=1428684 RepID=A0ABT2KST4_9BACL|nr:MULTISPECIES: chemotaxis protein CheC [Exiguobacterium]MDX5324521.1 chemotaxis protein CheC [Exiguobacterium sp.]MCT4794012.1 chemotaxis protein CheC [Exiguobacterium alkaliphilum]MDX5426365.1 chemotaxis protein CheC [Exiguobacterium sp.]MDX6773738.1 chemotaxis protein CheC [Exiguobacterium sp.]QUE85629.1 chemotaxis protein CheC [Exiguobacterium alkaliphilum]
MLSEFEQDLLKELGNIGSGHAATALSTLLAKPVNITVSSAEMEPISYLPERVGGPERHVASVLLELGGEIRGMILILFPVDDAEAMVTSLIGRPFTFAEATDLGQSAWEEIGNIMSGAYARALSDWLTTPILIQVPATAIDMAGSIVEFVVSSVQPEEDAALYIDTTFLIDEKVSAGHVLFLPTHGSLKQIERRLLGHG